MKKKLLDFVRMYENSSIGAVSAGAMASGPLPSLRKRSEPSIFVTADVNDEQELDTTEDNDSEKNQ